jgi:protein-disulfide isomerase
VEAKMKRQLTTKIETPTAMVPDINRDHIQGPPYANVSLLEYGDYECPYCGTAHQIIKQIMERVGDHISFVYRHFPLTNKHPHAQHAAEAVECAGRQHRFWEMHDLLFENQDDLDDESLAQLGGRLGLDEDLLYSDVVTDAYLARIREDFKSGLRGGVNGTPSFFINGMPYDGDMDLKSMLKAIHKAGR